ncbi:MAG: 4-(cytidine 5'-diphospho)-2-C-methyl-D-erythritol kinase [Verrucomicrobia bacterium]|nr:4-(cytidine 5'-diphospho)-2-C-methyl-D-erythritol kinase [Verrucomicrobiota bacterium]MBV8274701.1 4-(cytidine 5'-diphospho)-2-C-methyl-D-erythritol kinase [Verrucomicrobiota bacterium]
MVTPAKINLTLEVLGQRPDGYHELATWMIPIGLYDELAMELSGEMTYESNLTSLPFDSSNLISKAIDRFHEETDRRATYRIDLRKQIPIGAGLGGGSSDAAAALLLLNQLHQNPLTDEKLARLAAQLGSDVPFFLKRCAAWCTGRGEKMEMREFPHDRWVVLIKPEFGVSTAAAYSAYKVLPSELKRGQTKKTEWGLLRNDLEQPVFQKYLLLPEIKSWLEQQPETELALMSGSGSTMFAVVKSVDDGEQVSGRFSLFFGFKFWVQVCRLNPG